MKTIWNIVEPEISLVDRAEAREALNAAYADRHTALQTIETFFDRFTEQRHSPDTLRVFFRNWRSPGIGAASFCALTFRMMMRAEQTADPTAKGLLFHSATRLSQVSHEDVGIGTVQHQQLYEDFATRLSGDDQWRLDRYVLPNARPFLAASRAYRQNGDDLTHAITVSLPEELYNHGEFTFIASRFARWHKEILGRPREGWREDLGFIHDHLGSTESGHFAALMRGFEDYLVALQIKPDWTLLYRASCDLLDDMAAHYMRLDQHFREQDDVTACATITRQAEPTMAA